MNFYISIKMKLNYIKITLQSRISLMRKWIFKKDINMKLMTNSKIILISMTKRKN